MVFFLVAVLALFILLRLFFGSSRLFDATSRMVGSQVDVRRLVENIVKDVRGAHLILSPLSRAQWERDRKLVLFSYASSDARPRVQRNRVQEQFRDYPYIATTEGDTVQYLDVRRVTYVLEPESSEGSQPRWACKRKEAAGFLKRTWSGARGRFSYSFEEDSSVADSVRPELKLASGLEEVLLQPVAFLRDRTGKAPFRLIRPGADADIEPHQIALLALRLRLNQAARPREGEEERALREGVVELATKVWIDQKAMAIRFPEFFSSVDENLAF